MSIYPTPSITQKNLTPGDFIWPPRGPSTILLPNIIFIFICLFISFTFIFICIYFLYVLNLFGSGLGDGRRPLGCRQSAQTAPRFHVQRRRATHHLHLRRHSQGRLLAGARVTTKVVTERGPCAASTCCVNCPVNFFVAFVGGGDEVLDGPFLASF